MSEKKKKKEIKNASWCCAQCFQYTHDCISFGFLGLVNGKPYIREIQFQVGGSGSGSGKGDFFLSSTVECVWSSDSEFSLVLGIHFVSP